VPRMERDELPASLRAACTRHLGALGQDASTLLLLLRTARDGESFVRGVIDENLAALGDRSAALRVTAVTWLQGQQITVSGYDALASKVERKHALRQFLATREAVQ